MLNVSCMLMWTVLAAVVNTELLFSLEDVILTTFSDYLNKTRKDFEIRKSIWCSDKNFIVMLPLLHESANMQIIER